MITFFFLIFQFFLDNIFTQGCDVGGKKFCRSLSDGDFCCDNVLTFYLVTCTGGSVSVSTECVAPTTACYDPSNGCEVPSGNCLVGKTGPCDSTTGPACCEDSGVYFEVECDAGSISVSQQCVLPKSVCYDGATGCQAEVMVPCDVGGDGCSGEPDGKACCKDTGTSYLVTCTGEEVTQSTLCEAPDNECVDPQKGCTPPPDPNKCEVGGDGCAGQPNNQYCCTDQSINFDVQCADGVVDASTECLLPNDGCDATGCFDPTPGGPCDFGATEICSDEPNGRVCCTEEEYNFFVNCNNGTVENSEVCQEPRSSCDESSGCFEEPGICDVGMFYEPCNINTTQKRVRMCCEDEDGGNHWISCTNGEISQEKICLPPENRCGEDVGCFDPRESARELAGKVVGGVIGALLGVCALVFIVAVLIGAIIVFVYYSKKNKDKDFGDDVKDEELKGEKDEKEKSDESSEENNSDAL